MSIERDLTHAAFTEFLATQPTLAHKVNVTIPHRHPGDTSEEHELLLILIS